MVNVKRCLWWSNYECFQHVTNQLSPTVTHCQVICSSRQRESFSRCAQTVQQQVARHYLATSLSPSHGSNRLPYICISETKEHCCSAALGGVLQNENLRGARRDRVIGKTVQGSTPEQCSFQTAFSFVREAHKVLQFSEEALKKKKTQQNTERDDSDTFPVYMQDRFQGSRSNKHIMLPFCIIEIVPIINLPLLSVLLTRSEISGSQMDLFGFSRQEVLIWRFESPRHFTKVASCTDWLIVDRERRFTNATFLRDGSDHFSPP